VGVWVGGWLVGWGKGRDGDYQPNSTKQNHWPHPTTTSQTNNHQMNRTITKQGTAQGSTGEQFKRTTELQVASPFPSCLTRQVSVSGWWLWCVERGGGMCVCFVFWVSVCLSPAYVPRTVQFVRCSPPSPPPASRRPPTTIISPSKFKQPSPPPKKH
jgi:hypothetical protein